MFACESPAAFFASRRKRSTNWSSCEWRSSSILIATGRPSSWSSARYTFAIPPVPSLRTILYRPSKTESMSVSPVTAMTLLLRPAVQDCLQQNFGDRGGGRPAEPVLVLERDRDRDRRIVCRREADEP